MRTAQAITCKALSTVPDNSEHSVNASCYYLSHFSSKGFGPGYAQVCWTLLLKFSFSPPVGTL